MALYFDYVVSNAQRRLASAQGHERAKLARDSYSYLPTDGSRHPFIALGIKKTLSHVGDPLEVIPAVALCGGALYLLGHNAFRLRDVGSVNVPRLVMTVASCALILVAMWVPRYPFLLIRIWHL